MKIFTPPAGGLTNPMNTLGDAIVGGSGGTPARIGVGSNGRYLGADSTATNGVSYQSPANSYNYLVNGGFDYWQVGTSATVTSTGGATPTHAYLYQADQWYADNILGGGTVEGVVTYSQVTGVNAGSSFGAKFQITTAPTGTGIGNGLRAIQPLSAAATLPLLGQKVSFSIKVKALGNVNSIGIRLLYAGSETKLGTASGQQSVAVTSSVNTSAFTTITYNGYDTSAFTNASGSIYGVDVEINGVSSGNAYDLNNGFILEQAMLNLGPVALPFSRQYNNPAQELAACQYFYEKSYSLPTAPGSSMLIGLAFAGLAGSGAFSAATIPFKATKRSVPSMTYWDVVGNATKYSTFSSGAWAQTNNVGALTEITPGQSSFMLRFSGTNVEAGVQWVADARI